MRETPAVGDQVAMYQSGILLTQQHGTGHVTSDASRQLEAPVEAFVPLDAADDAVLPATAWPIESQGPVVQGPGTAVLDLGDRPLGQWLYLTYVAPVLR